MSSAAVLANQQAYDCWAASYPPLPHNPLMRAEQRALMDLCPELADACVLDLACGSGRYARLLKERGAAHVIAADYSPAMLSHAQVEHRVRADMMQLPFADASFDLVVCGLAVGHAPQLSSWMREVARVLRPGGVLLYSDFHPDAAQAGMTRSFTDAQQRRHVLQHSVFERASHEWAAAKAGLELEELLELRVGHELTERFPGSAQFYRRWPGLAVVLVVRACKT